VSKGLHLLPVIVASCFAIAALADDTPNVDDLFSDASGRAALHTVVPQYPDKARRARLEGEVEVCFNVSRSGKTSRVSVRRSTNRVFEKPSRDAVRMSTYRPLPPDARLSGVKTCRTFHFHLTPVAVELPNASTPMNQPQR